jgi:hypothetical protein
MNEPISLKGIWYSPENPEQKLSGTFSYTREHGCNLEVIGEFNTSSFFLKDRKQIIIGTTTGPNDVTLVNCVQQSKTSSDNGICITRYFAHIGLIGHHWCNPTEIVFNALNVRITDLEARVGIYGFSEFELNHAEHQIGINYQKPGNIEFDIIPTVKAAFIFHYELSNSSHKTDKIDLAQTTHLSINSESPLHYEKFLQLLFTFYKFFSFSYYDAPPILSLSFTNSDILFRDYQFPKTIDVYYSDHFFNKEYKEGRKSFEFIFAYKDIKDSFNNIIKNWFNLFPKIAPSINLLNELLIRKNTTLEIRFLSAIQAVETFHRNIFGGEEIPQAEFDQKLSEILAKVPEEYKDWVYEELKYKNEPKLRKRLSELYDVIPSEITGRLIKDKKSFIQAVLVSRNYFTHYNPALEDKAMSKQQLFTAVEKLKALLICSLMNTLGFSKEQIIKLAQIHKIYPFIE